MKYVRRKIPLKKKIHHEVCKEKVPLPLKKKIHHEVCEG